MDKREAGAVPAWALATAAVVVLGILVVLGASAYVQRAGAGVLPGVSVEGRNVGGGTREQLREVVDGLARLRGQQPVVVEGEREQVTATRAEVGAEADVEATVERVWALGREGVVRPLLDRLRARLGDTIEVELQEDVDRSRVESWAAGAAEQLSVPPSDAHATFVTSGADAPDLSVTQPQPGELVDGEDLAERLLGELEDTTGPIRLDAPSQLQQPTVTRADLDAVVPEAERAISGPIGLDNPSSGAPVELSPLQIARVLTIVRDPDAQPGSRLQIAPDPQALVDVLGPALIEAVEVEPVDATFVVTGNRVEIRGGTPGFRFDAESVAIQVAEVATSDERVDTLAGPRPEPGFTRAEAEQLGITQEVSSFTTQYTCCPPRVHNIQRMAEIVDGAIIAPGERFSLNDHVGPRTTDKGFVEGGVIQDGEFEEAVGGGVSQFATTFFNAAFFAGIELLDFEPHSYYIDRYPMGRESTINYGTIDVAVLNNSPYGILVQASASDTAVTVRFFSSPWAQVEARSTGPFNVVEGDLRDGFDIRFERVITYPDGSREVEEYFHRYQPEDEPDEEDDEGDDGDQGGGQDAGDGAAGEDTPGG